MGGHISVGVRRKDGSFETMGVWTNPLKIFIHDERFLNGSLAPLDEFFRRYRKEDRDFGGVQEHEPGEYGYVLIDAVEGIVLNCNNYTSLASVSFYDLEMRFRSDGTVDVGMTEDDVQLRELVRQYGRKARAFWGRDGEEERWKIAEFPKLADDQELLEFVAEMTDGGKWPHAKFDLEFPAWTVTDSRPDIQGLLAVKVAIEKCVTLTEAEQKAWASATRPDEEEDADEDHEASGAE